MTNIFTMGKYLTNLQDIVTFVYQIGMLPSFYTNFTSNKVCNFP